MEKNKLEHALQHLEGQKAANAHRKELVKRAHSDNRSTTISLPNGTTFMTASVNPLQLKVIIYIIKELQPYIHQQLPLINTFARNKTTENIAALNIVQGDLFREIKGNYYCRLPKKIFVRSRHYQEFQVDVDALSSMKIIFKKRNPLSNKVEVYKTTLFSTYEPEEDNSKSRIITIEMTKTVLEHLCNISVALAGEVQWDVDYYNSVLWEVVLRCKKRYTGLLYLFLCAWRDKGGWKIKTEDLKRRLAIGEDQYKRNIDFKRFVLNPAREELKKLQLDFWFEAEIVGDFTVFKVITPKVLEATDQMKDHIIKLMRSCRSTDEQINSLQPLLAEPKNHQKIRDIVQACINKFFEKKDTNSPINDLAAYVFTSLNNWQKNKLKIKKTRK